MQVKQYIVFLFLGLSFLMQAQDAEPKKTPKIKLTKAFISWGYNRSAYTKADVRIQGEGIDFTIHDAVGKDDPSEFDASVYLNPLKFTIPQFDFRMGVMVNDAFYVSFGWDHMKYKFQNSDYKVSGSIDANKSPFYGGTYDGSTVSVPKSFFYYEH